jgi:hypothetical protein
MAELLVFVAVVVLVERTKMLKSCFIVGGVMNCWVAIKVF